MDHTVRGATHAIQKVIKALNDKKIRCIRQEMANRPNPEVK